MKDLSMVKILSTHVEGIPLKHLFRQFLQDLWEKGEAFDSKRPTGNSDWQTTILEALANKENLSPEEKTHYSNLVRAAIRFMTL